ncbi:hypothetical protein LOTGIDRAFT_235435 [Lottia gigantea]|uniref:Uncharacterized protein n=1 Tax=Lottia gigantea TaxID=225164 RepID=V3ZZG6_LOTGI|nr:hypothetical protein LOTGIDRAFT_235435 [Lottia gigantea]ESO86376.1 hypothetical protein LOTGIDRAFT_235435 [Lottia gigantea]
MTEQVGQELHELDINKENSNVETSPSPDLSEGIPGVVNEGFQPESANVHSTKFGSAGSPEEELPPLTFVDFMPRCIGYEETADGKEPEFAQFRTVMEQANQWLLSMSQYKVYKVETIDRKLLSDLKLDLDTTLYHESSHGETIYLRGLRLWIVPQTTPNEAVQQISYITVLPDQASTGSKENFASLALSSSFRMRADRPVPFFDDITSTFSKLNRHLQSRPLPGKILNIETFPLKVMESLKPTEKPDVEKSCWSDMGKLSRLFIYAIRIFYIPGEQKFETVGFHDEEPHMVQNSDGLGVRVKYSPFTQVVGKTAKWIKEQKNIRIVNLQSLNIKVDKRSDGNVTLKSDISGYGELPFTESQYVKILRTYYVNEHKPAVPDLYSSYNLTTRLFVPIRHSGREFEAFSKTMQRAIAWLQVTKTPLFGMETVQYIVNPNSGGSGVNENRVDVNVNKNTGRYHLTCIRLYFSENFKEPSGDLLPKVAEDEAGWGCIIS